MKKFLITPVYIIFLFTLIYFSTFVWGVNLENKGTYRLWKYEENRVAIQRLMTDAQDVNHVVRERFYGSNQADQLLIAAQTDFVFWRDVNAVDYVAAKKAVAATKVVKWQAVVDKFAGPIDTE